MDVYAVAGMVRAHSVRAEVRDDGAVWGVLVYTERDTCGHVTTGREWQRIGTTRREALVWLGY